MKSDKTLRQRLWYFVTKIVLTYCDKKLFLWSRNFFEIRGWRPRICKNFEIIRTICSNSGRSEEFLVTECFFKLFLEVSHTYTAGWNVWGDWFLAVNHHNHKIWVPSILTHNLWLIFTGMKQKKKFLWKKKIQMKLLY